MGRLVVKCALTVVAVCATLLFFPVVLFFGVCDAVKLCAWILRDIMVNLWSGEWR